MKTSNPVLIAPRPRGRAGGGGRVRPRPYGRLPVSRVTDSRTRPLRIPGRPAGRAADDDRRCCRQDRDVARLTGLSAAAAWNLIPDALLGAAWIGAAMVGLVLGLIISFSRMANPALVVAYAVVEGAFVGLVSKSFEESGYQGIVLQAVVATFGVFFLMAMLYRARVIRATPKFTRGLIAVMGGLFAVMLINFVLALSASTPACAATARSASCSAWSASWSRRSASS